MNWVVCVAIFVLAVPAMSFGAVINLSSGGSTEIFVAPGGSFTVDVALDLEGATGVVGFDAQLRDSTGSGQFTWVKRTWGGSVSAGIGPAADDDKVVTKTGVFPAYLPGEHTNPASAAGTAVAIGVVASSEVGSYSQADIAPWVERLTLELDPTFCRYPFVISLENASIIYRGTTNAVPLRIGTSLREVPEPASLLSLAVGSVFLRRRRI